MPIGPLPIRLAAVIVFIFSFILFLSGWILQQQSLNALQAAISPTVLPHAPTATSVIPILPANNRRPPQQLPLALSAQPPTKKEKRKKVAYVQHVSSKSEICNTLMIFASLDRLGSVADRVLVYPASWKTDINEHQIGHVHTWQRLLDLAKNRYKVQLRATEKEVANTQDLLKSLFSETAYSRVLHLDNAGLVLRNLDPLLYTALMAPVAATREYWTAGEGRLSSNVLLVTPTGAPLSLELSDYEKHALILPAHPYNTVVSEFRREAGNHSRYLMKEWDERRVVEESYYVHFDESERRPWVYGDVRGMGRVARELYERYAEEREEFCGLELEVR